ncbi:hypothetical protein BDZ89DRAFT_1067436, partial [Hymenopellis radicata]
RKGPAHPALTQNLLYAQHRHARPCWILTDLEGGAGHSLTPHPRYVGLVQCSI